MRRSRIGLTIAASVLVVASCGGDDDSSSEDAADPPAAEQPADEPADEPTDELADEPADEPAEAGGGGTGQGTATLSLDNGEQFEFSVLCALEPQMAAGSEILFTAVSYDDIGLDITQFGDEGTVTGLASISVYDASYDSLWEAATLFEAFGGTIELSLDGSTITGSGSFYPAGDPASTPVDGEVVANC
jgi:hypothetical protein